MIERTPDERFAGLPDFDFDAHYTTWRGLRLHHLDEGEGRPIVLFHGEPTWSYLYRRLIPPLVASGHRAIAPDYPGFGKSDKPTDPGFYTYDTLTQSMIDLIDELDLEDATVVVQDWGGPIGLRAAVERSRRFSRLVVLNTGLYSGPGRTTPTFRAWRQFVEQTPDLPIAAIMRNAAVTEWPPEVIAGYEAPFPTPEHKIGARRLPLIVPLDDDDPGAAEMLAVRAALSEWTNPALVLFAESDPIFTPRTGERFAAAIPGSGPLQLVAAAGHFLQEDAPEAVAAAIVSFLERT